MKIRHLFSCQEGILGFLDVTYYIASVFGMAPYTRFLNNNGKYEYKPERISWGNASPIICELTNLIVKLILLFSFWEV